MTDAREITEALGGTWCGKQGTAFCPAHANTRTPALSVGNGDDGKLLLFCYAGCPFEDVLAVLRDRGILTGRSRSDVRLQAFAKDPVNLSSLQRRSKRAQEIWQSAQKIKGTLAEFYLWFRGIECGNTGYLRYAPFCPHPSGEVHPAMIARIEGSDGCAVHCTYLEPSTGKKAAVDPQKTMFGPVKRGAVRLVQGNGGLIVAEGIETCLSIQSGISQPPFSAWAALSTSGMRSLRLPPEPDKLIIAADGDTPGRQAAYHLAERARGLGWNVAVAEAPDGLDWNDVLSEGGTWH